MSEGVRVVRVSRGESQSGSVTMATCAVRLATTFLSRPQQESEKAFFFFFLSQLLNYSFKEASQLKLQRNV